MSDKTQHYENSSKSDAKNQKYFILRHGLGNIWRTKTIRKINN